MTTPRLLKRTVTEEIYDQAACQAPDIDDDENDAIDDDMDDAELADALRGNSDELPRESGIEAASTDAPDLDGEEDL